MVDGGGESDPAADEVEVALVATGLVTEDLLGDRDPASTVTWRGLLAGAAALVGDELDARRIVEEVSGWTHADLLVHLDDPPTNLALARFRALVGRRAAGEPLQYVLGSWGFRHLDLLVDRRVLIPRPETEHVVAVALEELERIRPGMAATVVDLGTGSGAIALSVAFERRATEVWATDLSPEALTVARANVAGIGRSGTRVRLAQGSWFAALGADLEGTVDLLVSNPPYVAAGDALPDEVRLWEPHQALVAGPTGLEAVEAILAGAPGWLAPDGVVVLEIGETQGQGAAAAAKEAGFDQVVVRPDLTGRDRVLVAYRSAVAGD